MSTGKDNAAIVPESGAIENLFNSIARDYDALNHILSLGTDRIWRKRALKYIVEPQKPQNILDVACGTGDFSIAIAKKANRETSITGVDLSANMLDIMRRKVLHSSLKCRVVAKKGNAEAMDFSQDSFDRVTIAFGIRNFEHREQALSEFLRVLSPGGRLVILELSTPRNKVVHCLYSLYFNKILPFIGGKVSGNKAAYKYLPASVNKFPGPEQWMHTMVSCGYKNVKHKSLSLGLCRIYTGEKL